MNYKIQKLCENWTSHFWTTVKVKEQIKKKQSDLPKTSKMRTQWKFAECEEISMNKEVYYDFFVVRKKNNLKLTT